MHALFLVLTAQCLHLAVGQLNLFDIKPTETPLSGEVQHQEATMCKPIKSFCNKICMQGFTTGSDGCMKCECFNPDQVSNIEASSGTLTQGNNCPLITCSKFCTFGYVRDENDCYLCACAQFTCSAAGDPFYTTFDKEKIEYQGKCQYELSGTIKDAPSTLKEFHVYVNNAKALGSERSYTESVTIEYGLHKIIFKELGEITIDGVSRTEAAELDTITNITSSDKLSVWKEGNMAFITFTDMFRISADLRGPGGRHKIKVVILNPGYRGYLKGICGNFNNDGRDDHYPKNSNATASDEDVGESWISNKQECGQ